MFGILSQCPRANGTTVTLLMACRKEALCMTGHRDGMGEGHRDGMGEGRR